MFLRGSRARTSLASKSGNSARLPSRMTTIKFADQPTDVENLKQGVYEAIVLSVGTAAAISGIFKVSKLVPHYWWIPLATNLPLTAIMAMLYWNDIQTGTTASTSGYDLVGNVTDYTSH